MLLFFLLELSNTRNYMEDVDFDELELAEESCCYLPSQRGCSDQFIQLAGTIMRENNLQFPALLKRRPFYLSLSLRK